MAFENTDTIIRFLAGLLISTVVIYLVTFLLGQRRGIKLAIFTAIIGTIVYEIAYSLLGHGFLATVLGGIAWLLAPYCLRSQVLSNTEPHYAFKTFCQEHNTINLNRTYRRTIAVSNS